MLPDVVLGCLAKALPGQVPAEGSSSLWNPMLSGGHGVVGPASYGDATPFAVTIFHAGGTARGQASRDCPPPPFHPACAPPQSRSPNRSRQVIYRRKMYRDGSGGAGKWRGGDGQIIEIEHSEEPLRRFRPVRSIEHPARGRDGGLAGIGGCAYLSDGSRLKGKGKQVVPAGLSLILELPGGGGLGTGEEQ